MKINRTLLVIMLLVILIVAFIWSKRRELTMHKLEAGDSLQYVYELETAYKEMFGCYTDNIFAIAFIQDTLVTEGGRANYQISLQEATDSTFTATAISVVDFDGDGQFNKWVIDETGCIKEIIKD